MSTSAEVRDVTPNDIDAVAAIEAVSFPDPWSRRAFAALVDREEVVFLVATREDRVVGFAVAWYAADQGELSNLAVDSADRRGGVGAQLLEAVMDRGRARGAVDLWLEVRESNVAARQLYQRQQFEEAGIRKAYYDAPREDAVIMRRSIGRQ